MDNTVIQNSSPQPVSSVDSAETTDQLLSVAELQRKQAEEKAKEAATIKNLDEIQERMKKNKALFYGLPILVLVYGIAAVFVFVVPSIQTYFKVNDTKKVLDKNLNTYKVSASNIRDARQKLSEYDKYESEVTAYIPTDSQLGSLINLIQTKASDFGLEQSVNTPSKDSTSNNSTINDLASRSNDDNSLFESINSGIIRFVPKGLSEDSEAKLLAIDVDVKGRKSSFYKFLEEIDKSKPIINLVYIDYQETNIDTTTGEAVIQATLRFESYNLKLGDSYNNKTVNKLSPNDSSLLAPTSPETFDLNTEIIKEFTEAQ